MRAHLLNYTCNCSFLEFITYLYFPPPSVSQFLIKNCIFILLFFNLFSSYLFVSIISIFVLYTLYRYSFFRSQPYYLFVFFHTKEQTIVLNLTLQNTAQKLLEASYCEVRSKGRDTNIHTLSSNPTK